MDLISIEFIAFAIIVCVLYFIIPKKYRWIELLISSFVFYFIASQKLAIFLVLTILSVYFSALLMGNIDEKTKLKCKNIEKDEKKKLKNKAKTNKKLVITATLLINFGILAALKYGNFIGSIVHINISNILLFENIIIISIIIIYIYYQLFIIDFYEKNIYILAF